jgi:Na+/melibiose symporter-like transporter
MLRLFAERNGRRYLVGQTVSLIGDRMLFLAMGIWIKTLTGSNGEAGLAFFFFAFPSLLAPLSGVLVDRLPRRPLLIWTNLLTGLVVASLVLVHGRGQVWLIYLVMFLYGASDNVLGSGGSAMLRMLFADDQLADANGYISTVQEGSRLFAPLAGAVLFTLIGGGALGLIDAGTFGFAALALVVVSVRELASESVGDHHWREYTFAGIDYLWKSAPLRQMTIATAVTLLMVGVCESIGFAVVSQGLHERPSFLGVVVTVLGVGALCGALSAAALIRRIGSGFLVATGLLGVALGCLGFTQSSFACVFGASVIFGVAIPWLIVGFNTAVQLLTPMELQGRVDSAANFLLGTPQSISIAAGAALVSLVDYRLLLVTMASVILGSAVFLATRPEQHPERLAAAAIPVAVQRVG